MQHNTQSGIVSLFSVIFLTIALTIATGVFSLLLGGFQIAGINRESIKAFYAADSGIECALYWELQHDSFATSTSPGDSREITCGEDENGVEAVIDENIGNVNDCAVGQNECVSTFVMPLLSGACTEVRVTKTYVGDELVTRIESRGKNNCDRPTVERAAEVTLRS